MRKKIFNEDESIKICFNCAYGVQMSDGEQILCEKSGIRNIDSTCRRFKYDPLCRIPRRAPELSEYSEEDFAL